MLSSTVGVSKPIYDKMRAALNIDVSIRVEKNYIIQLYLIDDDVLHFVASVNLLKHIPLCYY